MSLPSGRRGALEIGARIHQFRRFCAPGSTVLWASTQGLENPRIWRVLTPEDGRRLVQVWGLAAPMISALATPETGRWWPKDGRLPDPQKWAGNTPRDGRWLHRRVTSHAEAIESVRVRLPTL